MLLQLIPLPLSLVRIVAPNICQAYQPILTLPTLGNLYAWLPLTVNYKETLLEVLRLSSYALFYVLTIQLLTSSRRLRLTITLVTSLAICIAFFSILQRITAPDTLFGSVSCQMESKHSVPGYIKTIMLVVWLCSAPLCCLSFFCIDRCMGGLIR